MTFDESKFLNLSNLALCDYVADLEQSEFSGLSAPILAGLLDTSDQLDEEHAMYVIDWGVRFNAPGVSDAAMQFLNRKALWHGPQAQVLRVLCDAQDLTLEQVDRIQPGERQKFRNATFPDVFGELIDDLHKAVEAKNAHD